MVFEWGPMSLRWSGVTAGKQCGKAKKCFDGFGLHRAMLLSFPLDWQR
jgi:hypothetical protein